MSIDYYDAERVKAMTPWPALIDAIRDAFRNGGVSPPRHHHSIPGDGREDITLLLMPAWSGTGSFGVKLATVAPSNRLSGLPTLHGTYVLFSRDTGVPIALMDAGALTARRTAAASALASRYLSRSESRILLLIGTGRVARQLVAAHCSVRPIQEVRVWGRNEERTQQLVDDVLRETGIACQIVANVETGAAGADIISSATSAESPLLFGDWVDPGTHIDLVGAFGPTMCEADPVAITKAGQVFVDTLDGARDEAGDLIQAAAVTDFSFNDIAGDMFMLASGDESFRRSTDEITVFKSVGTALQDLAAAELCMQDTPAS